MVLRADALMSTGKEVGDVKRATERDVATMVERQCDEAAA
jgi:hypothetical protein